MPWQVDIKQGRMLMEGEDTFHIQGQQAFAQQVKGKIFEIVPFSDVTSGIAFALEIKEVTKESKEKAKEDKNKLKEEKRELMRQKIKANLKGKTIQ